MNVLGLCPHFKLNVTSKIIKKFPHFPTKYRPIMAARSLSFLLFVIAIVFNVQASSNYSSIFTTVSPKLIRPNSAYNVSVSVATTGQPTSFILSIIGSPRPEVENGEFTVLRIEPNSANAGSTPEPITTTTARPTQSYTSSESIIQPGSSATISIPVLDLKYSEYNLTIHARTTNEAEKYEEIVSVFKDAKVQSILLQTDKPIYKPGELVQFRVVLLNRELCPIEHERLEIVIKDPKQNIIKEMKQQKISNGLFSGKLQLSSEPNLGEWSIQASTRASKNEPESESPDEGDGQDSESVSSSNDGDSSTIQFTVDQYILPKFKIDLKQSPTFVTYNNSKFTLEVNAMYTYGKSLTGFCTVTISESNSYSYDESGSVKSIVKKMAIDGKLFVEFDLMKELVEKLKKAPYYNDNYRYERQFSIQVDVVDTLTSRTLSSSSTISMFEHAYKMELVNSPKDYKPGFPLTLWIKVSTQDERPVVDKSPSALHVKHGFSFRAEDGVLNFAIPESGLVKVTIPMPTNELMSTTGIEVEYKGQVQNLYPPQKFQSNSRSYIQVDLKSDKIALYSELKVHVRSNKAFDSLNYLLYGRGQILEQKLLVLPTDQSHLEVDFSITELPPNAAPQSTLIVYCTLLGSNEIIADSVQIKADAILHNQLSLKFSQGPAVEPGKNISVHIGSIQNSLVALRGVDQSVLILKKDVQDITPKTIDGEITKFENQWNNYRIWGGSSTFQVFDEAGLVVCTNGELEKQHWARPYYRHWGRGFGRGRMMAMGMAPAPIMMMDGASERRVFFKSANNFASSPRPPPPAEIRTRQKFPESWLWEEIYLNGSTLGTTEFHTTVPDTLTTWSITGYSLNPTAGIGVLSSPYTIAVFSPFFLTLNVPYSVVKGETFGLQVLVHNYLVDEAQAQITLSNVDDSIEFNEKVNKFQHNFTKSIQVQPNSVSQVAFVITPIKFGIIQLKVEGTTSMAGDRLSQPLIVKPPGHKITKTKSLLVDLKAANLFSGSLAPDFPKPRVAGADELKVSVAGDLLGSTITHMDKLLQMPTGCGEQNMLNFVPDIVILDYLKVTGQSTPEIETKAIRYLESGYQRELTYRHVDGSFSAFGASDAVGSTWLTAFVIKSFVAATNHITIDRNVVVEGLRFLVGKQHEDGSFIEFGRVLHSEMEGGGNGNSLALTAYIVTTFLEASNYSKVAEVDFDAVIQKGLDFIIKSYDIAKNDSYSISLICYALTLAEYKNGDQFLQDLDSLMVKDGELIHWESPKAKYPPMDHEDGILIMTEPFYFTRPVAVEMTSYALMTYLLRNDTATCLGIAKWLLQQRNSQGGFLSTQDTVVGLTALAKFASIVASTDTDISVTIGYGESKKTEESFKIDKNNAIVLQELYLPVNGSGKREVDVKATGKGTALVFLTWSYYVREKSGTKPAFTIDIKVKSKPGTSSMELKICTRLAKGDKSNMIVQEVNLPSGFAFAYEDILPMIKDAANFKRFDLEDSGTKLHMYFDYFLGNSTECLAVTASRVFKVSNPAKAFVHVYDYYDTTLSSLAFYYAPEFSTCDICRGGVDDCKVQDC